MDCFLSSVIVIAIFTETITNPRYIICCVGTRTNFSKWILNPSYRKSAVLALILAKRISKVSPSNSESLIYISDKCPLDLRYLSEGIKTFVKTLSSQLMKNHWEVHYIDSTLPSRTILDIFWYVLWIEMLYMHLSSRRTQNNSPPL